MNGTLIETKRLDKYFHEPETFKVLNGINLQINAGEFVAIMGPSGSGKSTLLYVLSTLDTDYEGKIIIAPVIQPQEFTKSFKEYNF